MRLTERVANGLQEVKLQETSEPERTTLGGLKRQGKKGTVGTKRTGNATLCKYSVMPPLPTPPNSNTDGDLMR